MLFKDDAALEILFWRFISGGNTVRGLLISLLLKLTILIALSYHSKEKSWGMEISLRESV